MFTDLEGYTSTAHQNEDEALKLLGAQDRILRPLLSAHRGRKVKSMGDGLLLEFPNARDAIECAVNLQRAIHEHNARNGAETLRMRVGIHLGDVERRGTDIFGDAVNIASRIEPLADAGGVCLSEQVFDQVHNKVPYQFEKLGPRTLRGIREPIDVYRVVLPWVGEAIAPDGPTLPRIAVLPLANISPDARDEYLSDGLTEELITVLSQLSELRVIARTSVMVYKAAPKPIPQVGRELNVGTVLEGSVRRVGNQLRITVQLIDVRSQEHLWAETFDRKLDDVLAVQSEVARRVSEILKIKVGKQERQRLDRLPTVQPDSYLAYLKGRALLSAGWAGENFRNARRQFEVAVSLDPQNARAYSGLADALILLRWGHFETSHPELIEESRTHARRALEIDPDLAEAHCSLGLVHLNDSRYREAESEFQKSLALNASYAFARRAYTRLLEEEGRPEEALREIRLAEELDPQSVQILLVHVMLLAWLRKVDEARAVSERLAKLAPDSPTLYRARGYCHYAAADYRSAMQEWRRVLEMDPPREQNWTDVAVLLALTGERDRAIEIIEDVRQGRRGVASPTDMARVFAIVGNLDEAFRLLMDAVDRREPIMFHDLRIDPNYAGLRRDPRFAKFLGKMNLA
jgi:adenylate cyclase